MVTAAYSAAMATAHPKNTEGPATLEDGLFGLGMPLDDAQTVIIPVPVDATASYGRGAADGPRAVLHASLQLDLFDPTTGRVLDGVAMAPIDVGIVALNGKMRDHVDRHRAAGYPHGGANAEAANALGTQLNHIVYEQSKRWLDRDRVVGVLGGDHSAPLGLIRALSERHELGILHIDAHADLRVAYEGFRWSHASIMHNVLCETQVKNLAQVALRDLCKTEYDYPQRDRRVSMLLDADLRRRQFAGEKFADIARAAIAALPADVYVSFDIDGLDPALCPNTGTPVPGGLQFAEACYLLEDVVASGRKIVGFDICEVAPGKDGEYDGNVGARILYKLASLATG